MGKHYWHESADPNYLQQLEVTDTTSVRKLFINDTVHDLIYGSTIGSGDEDSSLYKNSLKRLTDAQQPFLEENKLRFLISTRMLIPVRANSAKREKSIEVWARSLIRFCQKCDLTNPEWELVIDYLRALFLAPNINAPATKFLYGLPMYRVSCYLIPNESLKKSKSEEKISPEEFDQKIKGLVTTANAELASSQVEIEQESSQDKESREVKLLQRHFKPFFDELMGELNATKIPHRALNVQLVAYTKYKATLLASLLEQKMSVQGQNREVKEDVAAMKKAKVDLAVSVKKLKKFITKQNLRKKISPTDQTRYMRANDFVPLRELVREILSEEAQKNLNSSETEKRTRSRSLSLVHQFKKRVIPKFVRAGGQLESSLCEVIANALRGGSAEVMGMSFSSEIEIPEFYLHTDRCDYAKGLISQTRKIITRDVVVNEMLFVAKTIGLYAELIREIKKEIIKKLKQIMRSKKGEKIQLCDEVSAIMKTIQVRDIVLMISEILAKSSKDAVYVHSEQDAEDITNEAITSQLTTLFGLPFVEIIEKQMEETVNNSLAIKEDQIIEQAKNTNDELLKQKIEREIIRQQVEALWLPFTQQEKCAEKTLNEHTNAIIDETPYLSPSVASPSSPRTTGKISSSVSEVCLTALTGLYDYASGSSPRRSPRISAKNKATASLKSDSALRRRSSLKGTERAKRRKRGEGNEAYPNTMRSQMNPG